VNFTSYASSSRGNLYRLSHGENALLIEAGLPLKEIKKALGFKLSGISGCLLTHEHQDHSKAARDLMKAGVDVYCTQGTAEALHLDGHRLNIVKAMVQFRIGPWSVMPFDTIHDAAEPVGFLIGHQDGGKILFCTDTGYVRYRFKAVTHIAIEANYSALKLKEQVFQGKVHPDVARQLWGRHMSLEAVRDMLRANDLSQVQEIHLLHLSDQNSAAELFKKEIRDLTGKPVFIAG
jgi:phosphoribosyl 1,2-cyclic phosphodiesterase